jgi:hypothetical protein
MVDQMARKKKVNSGPSLAGEKKGGGVEALQSILDTTPATSQKDRLAKIMKAKLAKLDEVLTDEVLMIAVKLKEKGYGYGVVANTLTDTLGVKVSAETLKSYLIEGYAERKREKAAARKAAKEAKAANAAKDAAVEEVQQ